MIPGAFFDEGGKERGMIYELCDIGYGICVNGVSFGDWLECISSDIEETSLTEFVDKNEGGNDAENRYELCPGEAV